MLFPPKGKLLSLDLGRRYTGLAISDSKQRVVFPRKEIETKDEKSLLKQIKSLMELENIQGIIVGLPLSTKGEETGQSLWVRSIVSKLETELPLHFEDEAYSSASIDMHTSERKDSLVAQKLMEKVLGLKSF